MVEDVGALTAANFAFLKLPPYNNSVSPICSLIIEHEIELPTDLCFSFHWIRSEQQGGHSLGAVCLDSAFGATPILPCELEMNV